MPMAQVPDRLFLGLSLYVTPIPIPPFSRKSRERWYWGFDCESGSGVRGNKNMRMFGYPILRKGNGGSIYSALPIEAIIINEVTTFLSFCCDSGKIQILALNGTSHTLKGL